MMKRRSFLVLGLGLALGCSDAEIVNHSGEGERPAPVVGAEFVAGRCGSIEGQVIWQGERPVEPDLFLRPLLTDAPTMPRSRPFPQMPKVDAETHGLGNAVVFLRSVEAGRSKAWSHARVRLEMKDFRLNVIQGNRVGSVGFIWPGSKVEAVSGDQAFHALRATGAAFSTVPFPDPDQPARIAFSEEGVIELSSGAGYPWMKAHLFAVKHPYHEATDDQGRFRIKDVPEGDYELVCWVPNFRAVARDRDPESGRLTRITMATPLEVVKKIKVEAGQAAVVEYQIDEGAFPPR